MNVIEDKTEKMDAECFMEASELFHLMADMSRARIFWILCHKEICVTDIARITGMSPPAISHHLRLLRKNGLIVSRRSGKEMLYKAADTQSASILHSSLESLMEITCPGENRGKTGNF